MKTQTKLTLKFLEQNLNQLLASVLTTLQSQARICIKVDILQIYVQHNLIHDKHSKNSAEVSILELIQNFLAEYQTYQNVSNDLLLVSQVHIRLYKKGIKQPYVRRSNLINFNRHSTHSVVVPKNGEPHQNSLSYPQNIGQSHSSSLLDDSFRRNLPQKIAGGSQSSQLIVSLQDHNCIAKPSQIKDPRKDVGDSSTPHRSINPPQKIAHNETKHSSSLPDVGNNQDVGISTKSSPVAVYPDVQGWNRWATVKTIAAIVVLSLTSIGTYALTRPCVVGECSVLDTAQSLSHESHKLLNTVASSQDIVAAYGKLIEANYQLTRIPFWSKHYELAQTLLSRYQAEAVLVSQIVVAQQQAHEATISAREAPHPLPVWEDIRGQWQDAIAQLENVSDDIEIANLANLKLSEYENYLLTIDQQIKKERDAQGRIFAAREAAQIAEERENTAESTEDWQLVYVTWQVVMNRLTNIPKDTMAYAEAQHLNAIYSSRLSESLDRYINEQRSFEAYTQAMFLAEQAHQNEQSGQLTLALVAWQNAITNIEQISEDTSYYEQAQPLFTSYTEELENVQSYLDDLTILEQHRATLNQVCTDSAVICSYALNGDRIQIFVNEPHASQLRQYLAARIASDENADADNDSEIPKVTTLARNITTVGNDSQLPVELYDENQEVIAIYHPDVEGYIQADIITSENHDLSEENTIED